MDNYDSSYVASFMRNEDYLTELYDIRDEMVIGSIIKLYGDTRDSGHNVIITKQQISLNDIELITRLVKMSKLVENNIILIENIWIEESDSI
jgi:hypothetical protein